MVVVAVDTGLTIGLVVAVGLELAVGVARGGAASHLQLWVTEQPPLLLSGVQILTQPHSELSVSEEHPEVLPPSGRGVTSLCAYMYGGVIAAEL